MAAAKSDQAAAAPLLGACEAENPPPPALFDRLSCFSACQLGLSVRLADQVVPWHTFNLIGFGPVYFQACHSKYQSSRCQAETLSLYRCGIDLLG
jgi:hypothetical protein